MYIGIRLSKYTFPGIVHTFIYKDKLQQPKDNTPLHVTLRHMSYDSMRIPRLSYIIQKNILNPK